MQYLLFLDNFQCLQLLLSGQGHLLDDTVGSQKGGHSTEGTLTGWYGKIADVIPYCRMYYENFPNNDS